MSIRIFATLEERLGSLGYYDGETTNKPSAALSEAIIEVKRRHGLYPRDYVGPLTLELIFSDRVKPAAIANDVPPWLERANMLDGLHERHDNRSLRAFLSSDGYTLGDPAKLPWCGDFVETAVRLAAPDEPIPANPYLAANWMKFGIELDEPAMGAVLVFWRGSPASWKGHVGFYVGEDDTAYHVRGGNQSNAVTVARIDKDRLRKGGIRWPTTFPLPKTGLVRRSAAGALSTNEA